MDEIQTRKSAIEWITKAIGDLDQAKTRLTVMDMNRTHFIDGQKHMYLEVHVLMQSAAIRVKEGVKLLHELDRRNGA